jgi:hypothetical protein
LRGSGFGFRGHYAKPPNVPAVHRREPRAMNEGL